MRSYLKLKEQELRDFKSKETFSKENPIYIASAPIAFEKWNAFLLELFHKPRVKKKVPQYLIVPNRLKKHGKEREEFQPIKIKYSNVEMESEFGVAGEYTYFLSYGDKPYALLIKDKNFANTQTKIFNIMWKQAKF